MARRVLAIACWLFVVGVGLQVFLAGAGLFKATDFALHGGFGWLLSLVPVVLLVLALIAHVDRTSLGVAILLMIVTMIQPELAAARHDAPVIAAFHPVNALLIAFLGWTLARRATRAARQPIATAIGPEVTATD
jgi:hypothetical protein